MVESTDTGVSGLFEGLFDQLNVVLNYLPSIFTVILVLIVGYVVARLARRGVRRAGMASNRWLTRVYPSGVFSGARMSSLAVTILSGVVFWAIILIAVTIAARFAELGPVSQWLNRITSQLPNFVAGIGIVIVGYLLGVFVREQAQTETTAVMSSTSAVTGRIAQAVILTVALIVALDQVGIDVALLIGLAVVSFAGILAAVSVAFALGARSHVSNLIGARTAHAHLCAGMAIKIGDIEGEIVEITSSVVALDTDEGRILVPAKLVDESVITVRGPVKGQERTDD